VIVAAADFAYVRELVHRRSAIFLEPGKEYLVESRLQPIVQASGAGNLARFISRLRSSPEGSLHTQVVEAMTTNETSWFRDHHPFNALEAVILPDLLRRRVAVRRLTVWSAAAASGQEAYSIAMFLRNVLIYFQPDTRRQILDRVRRVLQPDGYLVVGGAETSDVDAFERVPLDKAAVYRIRGGQAAT
jgi:chemotaxis protein methyltransferase CheR